MTWGFKSPSSHHTHSDRDLKQRQTFKLCLASLSISLSLALSLSFAPSLSFLAHKFERAGQVIERLDQKLLEKDNDHEDDDRGKVDTSCMER